MSKTKELTGQKFGRLTVVSRAGSNKGRATWDCICICGNRKIISGKNLLNGITRSCGCLCKIGKKRHGMAESPLYQTWCCMRTRCTNINKDNYRNYGDRGITVCERWDKFENFYADMGDRPEGLTIERRDNSKGYSPENCKWATQKEQQRNRRNNRMIKYLGKTKCLAAWAEYLGISKGALGGRLNRHPPQIAFNM